MSDERPTRRRRRWLRVAAYVLGGLFVAAGLAVVLLLYTAAGARFLLTRALNAYDDRIAGDVEVAAIDGRIGAVILRGVVLRDSRGRALVQADTVSLDWSPLGLLGSGLDVELLRVAGAEVFLPHVPEGGESPFADLAPPPSEPTEEDEGLGPDLRVTLDARIALDGLTVRQESANGSVETLVDGAVLVAALDGEGRSANLRIEEGRAAVPAADLVVEGLTARAAWVEPAAVIEDLVVLTDRGRATVPRLAYDAATGRGEVDLVAELDRALVAAHLDAPVALSERPAVALSLRGGPDGFEGGLELRAVPDASLWLRVEGHVEPSVDVQATFAAGLAGGRYAPIGADGRLGGFGEARLTGTTPADLVGSGFFECVGCAIDPVGAFDLRLAFDYADGTGMARLHLDAAGVEAEVLAGLANGETLGAEWSLRVADVTRPAEVAARFVDDLPEVTGSLATTGQCFGALADPTCLGELTAASLAAPQGRLENATVTFYARPLAEPPRFAAEVSADEIVAGEETLRGVDGWLAGTSEEVEAFLNTTRGRDRARLRATIRPGPPLDVELDTVEATRKGVKIRLESPGRIKVMQRRVEVQDLRFTVDGGRIRVDGVYDQGGPSDLEATIRGLSLRSVMRLVDGPTGVGGSLTAEARVTGPPDDPEVTLSGRARGLRVDQARLGDARVRAKLADGRLRTTVRLDGGLAAELEVTAVIPLDVNLATFAVTPRPGGRQRLEFRVAELYLARLADAFDLPPLAGTLSLVGELSGAGTRLSGRIAGSADDVAVRGLPVGDIGIAARYGGQRLRAELSVDQGVAKELVASADVPLTIDLSRGRFEWRQRARHDVTVRIESLYLDRLDEYVPDLPLEGVADVLVHFEGPATAPTGRATLVANKLQYDLWDLGDIYVEATLGRDAVDLIVDLQGPIAERVELVASIPVAVRPLAGDLRWQRDRAHTLRLTVEDLELDEIHPGLDLDGLLDLRLHAEGNAATPDVSLELATEGLRLDREPVGDLQIAFNYLEGRVDIAGRLQRDEDTDAILLGSVPVRLDLAAPDVRWLQDDEHRFQLIVNNLDTEAVRAYATLPEGSDVHLNARLEGTGSLDDFVLTADAEGALDHPDMEPLPVTLTARVEPAAQTLRVVSMDATAGPLLEVDVAAEAPLRALRRGETELGDVPIRARVDAGLDLARLEAVMPPAAWRPRGQLAADATIEGPFRAPSMDGSVRLDDGEVTLVDLGQRLTGIQLLVRLEGREVLLDTFVFESGRGEGEASGRLVLEEGRRMSGQLALRLDDFPIVRPGLPRGIVGARVEATLRRDPELTDVDVDVRRTEVRLIGQNVPAPKPIPRNDNVLTVAELQAREEAVRENGRRQQPGRLRLDIELVDPVVIDGNNLQMRWGGRIVMERDGENDIEGALIAESGRAVVAGQEFVLESGLVTLVDSPDGGVDPFLDITAVADTPEAVVTATVRGRASRPDLILSSDPPLPDFQILALVITGQADSAGGNVNVQQQAASVLAAVSSTAIERELNERIGLDRVGLAFGEELDEPILTVGKRLTRRLYFETRYHHNADFDENSTEARVELQIAPRWALETSYGDAGVGAVEFFWRRSFGADAPTTLPQKGEAPEDYGAAEPTTPRRPSRAAAEPRKE